MTWSEQEGSVVLTDAYTLVYVSRQYSRTFLSDTRHTSFYSTAVAFLRLWIYIRQLWLFFMLWLLFVYIFRKCLNTKNI